MFKCFYIRFKDFHGHQIRLINHERIQTQNMFDISVYNLILILLLNNEYQNRHNHLTLKAVKMYRLCVC